MVTNLVKLEPMPGRVPPSDLDAEAAVLSAAMLDENALSELVGIVRSVHFYADANRRIFEAIVDLHSASKTVDTVGVASHLRDKGRLDQIGGTPYLAQLTGATPAIANAVAHATIVIEKWRVRQLISTCQKYAAEGYGDTGDVQTFIAQAHTALADIAANSPAGSKLALTTSDQIFAPLEEPRFVIDQVIRRASITQLVGYGGGSKTWLAIGAALAIAAGHAWLGRFRTTPGRAAYLDYENGQYEMRRRFKGVALSMGLGWVGNLSLCTMPAVYMSDGAAFANAIAPIAKSHDFIVIDTLKAASPGVDENDSNMRVGLDHLRRVAEQTGCAFLVLVHSKKTSGAVTTIDPREVGRGSSAIFDAADSVLHIAYSEGKPLRVTQTKARLGKVVEPFHVTIEDGDNGSVYVRATDIESERQLDAAASAANRAKFDTLCDRVVEAVKSAPGASGRMVRQLVGGARAESVLAALEHLERHGAVRNSGNSKGAKWYPTGKHIPPKADESEGVDEDFA